LAVTIPWSSDPAENRRNIQAAMDAGETEINGEMDENGNPKPYEVDRLPVPPLPRASTAHHSEHHSEDKGTETANSL
jgi:hypothetical protein